MKGQDKIQQQVQLPRLDFPQETGREIMAVWRPLYESYSYKYLTDANGLEFIERQVPLKRDREPFSKTFYPVESVISMQDR